jgi:hypothetical protein
MLRLFNAVKIRKMFNAFHGIADEHIKLAEVVS